MTWELPREPEALLSLALDYPYDAPGFSYLLNQGAIEPLTASAEDRLFAGRQVVVAHGSNRAPAQLLRKFGVEATIPVTYGWLEDYDVVYGAHVARYGAITSTLVAARACRVRVAATWLTPAQLALMHATERMNYTYGLLPLGAFRPEVGPDPASVAVYLGNHGALMLDGTAVAFAAVEAQARAYPALLQHELQRRLLTELLPGRGLSDAILERIGDAEIRRSFAQRLPRGGPTFPDGFQLLRRLDDQLA